MEQNPSWEANRPSGIQEISHIVWYQKVYCYIHKHLSLNPYED
jgi:hypothetical protein